MSAADLLSRITKVKETGPRRWVGCCPSHEDRTPSLAVREIDDGRVLVHCFAGCAVEEVLAAAGLEFDALFPPKPIEFAKAERRPFLPSDVFEVARMEISIVAVIASDMHAGRTVPEADYDRLYVAIDRLNGIAGAAYGIR